MTASSSGNWHRLHLRLATLSLCLALASALKHLGCHFLTNPDYVLGKPERQFGDNFNLMPYYQHNMPADRATPATCATFCLTKGLEFAALRQSECACGISMDGMREARPSGALGEQCNSWCRGDASQRCGGSNVISVYQSEPQVRTQLPSRCATGYWRVTLNKSSEYQPNLIAVRYEDMMWRTHQMGTVDPTRLNLQLCIWKCETLPTCWSVIEQASPGKFLGCALLDKPTALAASQISATKPGKPEQFSLAVWTCSSQPPPPTTTDGPSKQPDSDRLEAGGVGGGGRGGGDGGSGSGRLHSRWRTVAAVAMLTTVVTRLR